MRVKARELAISRAFWLDAMNEDLAKANKIFGTDMRVVAVRPTEDEMKLLEWEGGGNYDIERSAADAESSDISTDMVE